MYGNFVCTSWMLSNLEISVKNAVQQILSRDEEWQKLATFELTMRLYACTLAH